MDPNRLVERLRQAVNDHDLDALVACFSRDYRNETPAHPARSFDGHAQVRTNWQRIFAALPDVAATVLRCSVDDEVVWSEWELVGHRPDGGTQMLRGVIIFGTTDEHLVWARFYVEPVDAGDGGVDAAVGTIVADARR